MRVHKVICDECGLECGNEWYCLAEQERIGLFHGHDKDFCTHRCREIFLSKEYDKILSALHRSKSD